MEFLPQIAQIYADLKPPKVVYWRKLIKKDFILICDVCVICGKYLFMNSLNRLSSYKKSNGQKLELYAIYTSRKYFMTSIKAKKFTYHLKTGRKIDIIMLFPQAEKGDKIITDDFIETEIQE